jgi:hypothetical protein
MPLLGDEVTEEIDMDADGDPPGVNNISLGNEYACSYTNS